MYNSVLYLESLNLGDIVLLNSFMLFFFFHFHLHKSNSGDNLKTWHILKHVSPASECIKCICIVNVHLKGTVYKCTLDLTHGQHKSYANWFNSQRSLWAITYLHRISKDYNRTFRHTGKSFLACWQSCPDITQINSTSLIMVVLDF